MFLAPTKVQIMRTARSSVVKLKLTDILTEHTAESLDTTLTDVTHYVNIEYLINEYFTACLASNLTKN